MPTAQRDSWQTLAPGRMAPLPYHATLSHAEYATIRPGLIPEEMEDKWFVFWESESLFFHRSWTGHCVYQADFQPADGRFAVAKTLVSADREFYHRGADGHEVALLDFLIRGLLLHQSIECPVPPGLRDSVPRGLYQHHIAGTGFPERALESEQPTLPSELKRWLGL